MNNSYAYSYRQRGRNRREGKIEERSEETKLDLGERGRNWARERDRGREGIEEHTDNVISINTTTYDKPDLITISKQFDCA